ncbi:hypothetical protein [Acinetobacter sp.]|uniref:hypothetical protein n=1 Tax=Acinetobacter sp. TaxID=472 RepID=UPI00388CF282
MRPTTIDTTLVIGTSSTTIKDVYLLVVPDYGEKLTIDGKEYRVKTRHFHLKEIREGSLSYGYTQTCTLFLTDPTEPVNLNC